MKNIFKFMGIALMASALLVACNKDEKTDTTDTTPATPVSKLSVSFNGAQWDAASSIFLDATEQNYLALYGFKVATDAQALLNGSDATAPYISGTLMTVVGSYTYESSEGDYVQYVDPTDIYYYEGDEQNEAGNYLRWNVIKSTFTENITAVDLTALTMSATFSCDHFDLEQVANNGWTSYGETATLNGTLDNYNWTWTEVK